jgi:hypothetical protein
MNKNKVNLDNRDWWNQGINPITGYRIPNQRNVVEEEKKYKIDSYGIK